MKAFLPFLLFFAVFGFGCQSKDDLKNELRVNGWKFSFKNDRHHIDVTDPIAGELHNLGEFPEVQVLRLGPTASNDDLQTVAELPNLEELWFKRTAKIDRKGFDYLKEMETLRTVVFTGYRGTDPDLAPLEHLANLKSLIFTWECSKLRGGPDFPRPSSLEVLDLGSHPELSEQIAKDLSGFPNLRVLVLYGKLPHVDWDSLIKMKNLEELDLGTTTIDERTLKRLNESTKLHELVVNRKTVPLPVD